MTRREGGGPLIAGRRRAPPSSTVTDSPSYLFPSYLFSSCLFPSCLRATAQAYDAPVRGVCDERACRPG